MVRWYALTICAVIGLLSTGLVVVTQGVPTVWVVAALLGFAGAAGVGYRAATRELRVRWPAAVALVCIAPMVTKAIDVLPNLGLVGIGWLLVITGSLATTAAAVVALVTPFPPAPSIGVGRDDPKP